MNLTDQILPHKEQFVDFIKKLSIANTIGDDEFFRV